MAEGTDFTRVNDDYTPRDFVMEILVPEPIILSPKISNLFGISGHVHGLLKR